MKIERDSEIVDGTDLRLIKKYKDSSPASADRLVGMTVKRTFRMNPHKIISGGQTGVDQAALQAAIDLGLEHGGWCPPGRVCEDGIIPDQFVLIETNEERSPDAKDIPRSQRTEWNIRDADASLIVLPNATESDPGTARAIEFAGKLQKPILIIDPGNAEIDMVRDWISKNKIKVLGVGGPSERTVPGIYDLTFRFIMKVFNEK